MGADPGRRLDRSAADPGSRPPDRFSFVGSPDPELERRYVGRSVAAYLGAGPAEPGDLRVVRAPLGQHRRR